MGEQRMALQLLHHGDHPVEDPKWVLAPVAVGLLIGLIVAIVIGLNSGATPFHSL